MIDCYFSFFFQMLVSCSPKRDFGLDLVSLNLWRGRDHGLPGYNAYRQICGMSLATTFEELLPVMEKSVVDRLALVYHSVDDIDLFVGGLVERHLPGSMLGPVFSCIIADQFSRLKEGDRFYYEHGSQINSFTPGKHSSDTQLHFMPQTTSRSYLCSKNLEIWLLIGSLWTRLSLN